MAYHPITMNLVKQIIQLQANGVGIKTIAAHLGISKNTVKAYLRRKHNQGLTDQQVISTVNPMLEVDFRLVSEQQRENYEMFLKRAEYYAGELANRKRTHVTRMILWEEDYRAGLIRLKYSQFCDHLKRYLKSKHPSLVMVHRPGEKMFMDFAGDKLYYREPKTGNHVAVEVLLLTLGYSNYTVAVAIASQKTEDLIEGSVVLFSRLGSVASVLVPDNLKSAVTTPDLYEAVINERFLDMANYYGLVVMPTRPVKPKDKAKVETHVNVVYQQVYARLRNMTFYSLEELNSALTDKMAQLNEATMQDYGVSRKTLLERDERIHLKPLPACSYALTKQYRVTVGQNNHVKLTSLKKYISVPHRLIGQKVTVLVSGGIARVYYERECVATHALKKGELYLTKQDHLPTIHQEYLQSLSPDKLCERARCIGPEVEMLIKKVLERGQFPQQMFKTCEGILALRLKCEPDRYKTACRLALANDLASLRYMRHLVSSDHLLLNEDLRPATILPEHPNIRGRENYQ